MRATGWFDDDRIVASVENRLSMTSENVERLRTSSRNLSSANVDKDIGLTKTKGST